jgi:hypothetical protein
LPGFDYETTIASIRGPTPVHRMEDQNPPDFNSPPPNAPDSTAAAWQDLLAELTELHSRLEYLRLLLKLGVRGF